MGQTRVPKEQQDTLGNCHPEHRNSASRLKSPPNLLGKPRGKQQFHGQINLQWWEKGRAELLVIFKALHSNMEDKLRCYQLLHLHDNPIYSKYISIHQGRCFFPGTWQCLKQSHYLPETPRDQVNASISSTLHSAATFPLFLFQIARVKCVQAKEVKWDQLLLIASYKVSTTQGVSTTSSYWRAQYSTGSPVSLWV